MHYTTVLHRIRNAILNPAWICFLWVGITVGVSLIATPVRFTAPSITRPIALDVGRVVFNALNKAEILALVILLVIVRAASITGKWWAYCALLALILLAQGAWLIPELAARTDVILAGGVPPPSHAHGIYAALELAKIGLLLIVGFSSLNERR